MGESNSKIIQRLYDMMMLRGLSINELARRTGIDKSLISRYVNHKAMPKIDNIVALAKVLRVSPAWLLCLDDAEAHQANTPADDLLDIGIDIRRLTRTDIDKLKGYYQCLIDAHNTGLNK